MVFGSLMMILFWGGLILLIVLAVRYLGHGSAGGGERPAVGKAPLQILEERFARGEIDKEEFDQRKRALSK
jgi:putative membrane protein